MQLKITGNDTIQIKTEIMILEQKIKLRNDSHEK